MKLVEKVEVVFSTSLFVGAVLWALSDGGWEPCLAAIASLASIIYFFNRVKNGSVNAVVIASPETSIVIDENHIQNLLQNSWREFLITTNIVELERIKHQLSTITVYNSDAQILYDLIEKSIQYHKGNLNFAKGITMLIGLMIAIISMSILLILKKLISQ